jgi:hypothetical protein
MMDTNPLSFQPFKLFKFCPNHCCNNFNSIPCTKCKYFHNNYHLKCAVNPSKVLQPEAKECLDYSFRPHKKLFGLDKFIDNNRDIR